MTTSPCHPARERGAQADFETAWDAVAQQPDGPTVGRGNFMFALHATVLLEWACRVCGADTNRSGVCRHSPPEIPWR
jgi:hypothetical protein